MKIGLNGRKTGTISEMSQMSFELKFKGYKQVIEILYASK